MTLRPIPHQETAMDRRTENALKLSGAVSCSKGETKFSEKIKINNLHILTFDAILKLHEVLF